MGVRVHPGLRLVGPGPHEQRHAVRWTLTVAWGRDYGDVTPVKGISLGGGGQTVEVEVRVVPASFEESPSLEPTA